MIGDRHKRAALYFAWALVFASTFTAGVYTLGLFVDTESVGTAEDPNTIEVAEEFAEGDLFGGGHDFGNDWFGNGGFGNGGNAGNAGNAALGVVGMSGLCSRWLR